MQLLRLLVTMETLEFNFDTEREKVNLWNKITINTVNLLNKNFDETIFCI